MSPTCSTPVFRHARNKISIMSQLRFFKQEIPARSPKANQVASRQLCHNLNWAIVIGIGAKKRSDPQFCRPLACPELANFVWNLMVTTTHRPWSTYTEWISSLCRLAKVTDPWLDGWAVLRMNRNMCGRLGNKKKKSHRSTNRRWPFFPLMWTQLESKMFLAVIGVHRFSKRKMG